MNIKLHASHGSLHKYEFEQILTRGGGDIPINLEST